MRKLATTQQSSSPPFALRQCCCAAQRAGAPLSRLTQFYCSGSGHDSEGIRHNHNPLPRPSSSLQNHSLQELVWKLFVCVCLLCLLTMHCPPQTLFLVPRTVLHTRRRKTALAATPNGSCFVCRLHGTWLSVAVSYVMINAGDTLQSFLCHLQYSFKSKDAPPKLPTATKQSEIL